MIYFAKPAKAKLGVKRTDKVTRMTNLKDKYVQIVVENIWKLTEIIIRMEEIAASSSELLAAQLTELTS